MTTLTKKQATFLRKAMSRDKSFPVLQKLHVQKYDGRTYAGATDRYTLHAVPVEAEPGVYDLDKDGTLTLNPEGCNPMEWQRVVPMHLTDKQNIVRQKEEDWKPRAKEARKIVINTENKYTVDYRYYCNATSYDKTCIQRLPEQWMRPMKLDYQDGTFAVVMPMHPPEDAQQS